MDELKCPCCGGKSRIIEQGYTQDALRHVQYYTKCLECGISTLHYDTRAEAIAAFTRRPALENKPLTLEQLMTKQLEEWRTTYIRMKEQWKHDCDLLVQAGNDNAAKDQQIATLEKALGLACERIAEYAFCGGTDAMKQKHAKKNIQHFIQQAQEQEADHA